MPFLNYFCKQNSKNNCCVIFSNLLHFFISNEMFIPSQLYRFIKDLIFYTLCKIYWQRQSVLKTSIVIKLRYIVAFLFLSNQDNLYMIQRDSDLFYDIFYTINQSKTRPLHLIDSCKPILYLKRINSKISKKILYFSYQSRFYIFLYQS